MNSLQRLQTHLSCMNLLELPNLRLPIPSIMFLEQIFLSGAAIRLHLTGAHAPRDRHALAALRLVTLVQFPGKRLLAVSRPAPRPSCADRYEARGQAPTALLC